MADNCIGRETGECKGPVVADLVLQLKRGSKNVGRPQKLPLGVVHAIRGGAYSWVAHTGEAIIWSVVRSIAPATRKGLSPTNSVVVREPCRRVLKRLGL